MGLSYNELNNVGYTYAVINTKIHLSVISEHNVSLNDKNLVNSNLFLN